MSETPALERGLFIVLEGIDNCGKTTQSRLLNDYLEAQGVSVIQTREPGGTVSGEEIRKILLKSRDPMLDPKTQGLLFFAARAEFLRGVVLPNLEHGVTVISDRFEASTFVYQCYTQGMPTDLFDSLSRHVVRAVNGYPDLYIILDITAEESIRRQDNVDNKGQKLVYEMQGLEFVKKLRNGYKLYADGYYLNPGHNTWSGSNAVLIDGMKTHEEIHQEIVMLVEDLRKRK